MVEKPVLCYMSRKKFWIIGSLVVVCTILISTTILVFNSKPVQSQNSTSQAQSELRKFSKEELKVFDGSQDDQPIYIGLNGKVYDVSKGRDFYKTGAGYHYLAGKDSSADLNIFGASLITNKYSVIGLLAD